ncbi:DUF6232 family protein [Deinococcus aquatilis]|uniref:DUF6232 family protein n=1 Tax=Deinococcus aquatilis TaxID=519440 RepID=UPI0012F82869|nr:DUF6232 family protein [Deinococcus aquatilis]
MSSAAEPLLYQDSEVQISRTRFVFKNKTVLIRDLTAATTIKHKPSPSDWIFLAVGCIYILAMDATTIKMLGIILISYFVWSVAKPIYSIVVDFDSLTRSIFASRDRKRVSQIVETVQKAISQNN